MLLTFQIYAHNNFDESSSGHFATISACDRQTDRQILAASRLVGLFLLMIGKLLQEVQMILGLDRKNFPQRSSKKSRLNHSEAAVREFLESSRSTKPSPFLLLQCSSHSGRSVDDIDHNS